MAFGNKGRTALVPWDWQLLGILAPRCLVAWVGVLNPYCQVRFLQKLHQPWLLGTLDSLPARCLLLALVCLHRLGVMPRSDRGYFRAEHISGDLT